MKMVTMPKIASTPSYGYKKLGFGGRGGPNFVFFILSFRGRSEMGWGGYIGKSLGPGFWWGGWVGWVYEFSDFSS